MSKLITAVRHDFRAILDMHDYNNNNNNALP